MTGVPVPFREPRRTSSVLGLPTDHETIPMILGYESLVVRRRQA